MSRLNRAIAPSTLITSHVASPHGVTTSANGNLQSIKAAEQQVFEALTTTLYGKDSFYKTADEKVRLMRQALGNLVASEGDAGVAFALRAAVFARTSMNIRTMPIVMLVELAKIVQTHNLNAISHTKLSTDEFRSATRMIIRRADQLTDAYAYALEVFGKKNLIPMSFKRGVADAFNSFDEYAFGKYDRDNQSLKFKDLLRIVHAKPKDDAHAAIFNKIVTESLATPHTWEVELSKNGQLSKAERETDREIWTRLIDTRGPGELGYMALIRNLRNMHDAGISVETWKKVVARLTNPDEVAKSKMLPFNFISAWEIARQNALPNAVIGAIEVATELAVSTNLPKLGDAVWVMLDTSSSMTQWGMSCRNPPDPKDRNDIRNHQVSAIKTAAIFAAILAKAAQKSNSFDFKLTLFSNSAVHLSLPSMGSVFSNFEYIMKHCHGGGTNLQAALNLKGTLGFEPDTVIVISDMEVNRLTTPRTVASLFNRDCVKIALNIDFGVSTPLGDNQGWTQLAGWSEKIFQFIDVSRNHVSVINKIRQLPIYSINDPALKETRDAAKAAATWVKQNLSLPVTKTSAPKKVATKKVPTKLVVKKKLAIPDGYLVK